MLTSRGAKWTQGEKLGGSKSKGSQGKGKGSNAPDEARHALDRDNAPDRGKLVPDKARGHNALAAVLVALAGAILMKVLA